MAKPAPGSLYFFLVFRSSFAYMYLFIFLPTVIFCFFPTPQCLIFSCFIEKEDDETRFSPDHFQVCHSNNVFELSWCHCRVGATPASRSNCLQTRRIIDIYGRIHHQVKYRCLNANTCIVAAILFSGHPYIGRHGTPLLFADD